jgi:hypothetical protein
LLAAMVIEPHERARFWIINLLVWFAVAVVFSVQSYLERWSFNLPRPDFFYLLAQLLGRSLIWALLTPVILRLGEILPLSGPRRFLHLGAHIILSVAAMLGVYFVMMVILRARSLGLGAEHFFWWALSVLPARALNGVPYYWAVLAIGSWMKQAKQRSELQLREARLQAELAESQLRALQGQLKPHFTHNALNAVAALISEGKPKEAIETLANISTLLRTLSDAPGRHFVPLREEMDFIRRLLAVEQLRFGEKLEPRIEMPPDCAECPVPHLVLQPFVENAIKHGIAQRVRPGRVYVRARREKGRLRLEVLNDGPRPEQGGNARLVKGVGLASTLQRLERVYGNACTVEMDFQREEDVRVTVTLPIDP